MRVSDAMMSGTVLADIQNAASQLNQIESHLSSGKSINLPSDNPGGTAVVLSMNTSLSQMQQYLNNISDGQNWVSTVENALQDVVTVLQKARTLVTEAGTAAEPPTSIEAILAQMNQLQNQLVNLANTQLGQYYVFGGTGLTPAAGNGPAMTTTIGGTTVSVPVTASGATVNTVTLTTDSGAVMREIGQGQEVQVNAPAQAVFGQAFSALQQIQGDLYQAANSLGGTTPSVNLDNADLTALDQALTTVITYETKAGASADRLQLAQSQLQSSQTGLQQSLAQTEDVDMAKEIVNYQQAQNAFQLALQVGAKVIMPSIFQYLQ
jgi:flagellar hook-associated protein 3 FlgL